MYSLTLGDIPSIAAFLDSGAVKLGAGVGKERMTPLHYASAQGNFELVEFLLERKAKVFYCYKKAQTGIDQIHRRITHCIMQLAMAGKNLLIY